MADQPEQGNGALPEPKLSLRDIAESAYDEVTEVSEVEEPQEVDEGGRQRDSRGRFVSRDAEPGEAEAEEPPSPEDEDYTQETAEHPAPETGVAAQAPSNWSAEDRANFEKLPPEGKAFLLRRHSEMEGDYQKRVQATAVSNQFVQAVVPVFNDPDIAESLRQEGRSPIEAVYQWAGFHKRALSPDLNTRVTLLFDLANRMQIDPAAVFGLSASPAGLSQEDLANPAVKKFAETLGQLNTRIQAQETWIQQMTKAQEQALTDAKRVEIDAFADQKNADGSPAHPYFDALLPVIMDHFRNDPTKNIEACYKAAVEPIFGPMQNQLKARLDHQQNVQRAQVAVRGNVRGMTAPVSKPSPPNGVKKSVRDVLEESAEEIGW